MNAPAKKCRLGDLVTFVSGGTPSKQNAAYWGGDTPWVSAKDLKSFRIGSSIDTLSEEGRKSVSLLPVGALLILVRGMSLFKGIPLGVATRELAINQDLKGLIPKENVSSIYIAYSLQAQKDTLLQMVEAAGHGTGRLDTETLKSLSVRIPPIKEQNEIVDTLTCWDFAIEKSEQLIAAKNQLLAHLREHHLVKPKQSSQIKLKSVTHESTIRNGSRLGRDAIMAVTKSIGMRPMREETIAAVIDRYKLVRPKAFAYNPMRLNIGSIAMSRFDRDVLVSPDYVVFECDESKLLPGYLEHLRHTRLWGRHFEAAGSGGVRIRIYYDDLGAFAFPLPPVAQQLRVLAALDAVKAEIQTLESYLAALQQQKRGLMQKLLTGQWRIQTSSYKE